MKQFKFCPLLLVLVLALFAVPATAQVIKTGDTATVPSWEWVEVMNQDRIRSANTDFSYGETCGVETGGNVKVIGIDGDRLLVSYTAPGRAAGTRCPSGIMFFTSKEKFSGMTEKYNQIEKAKQDEKALVRKLTGK